MRRQHDTTFEPNYYYIYIQLHNSLLFFLFVISPGGCFCIRLGREREEGEERYKLVFLLNVVELVENNNKHLLNELVSESWVIQSVVVYKSA